jgi:2-methylisocitrate lyase-like PEP mutase family enzyme
LIFQGSAQERRPNCCPMVMGFGLVIVSLLSAQGSRQRAATVLARWPMILRNEPMTRRAWIDRRDRFRALHRDGLFVMPNPWDIGSARLLASLGFAALATTSSGHAAALGRVDQSVTRDELLAHVEALVAAVDLPLNVDAERCFADDAPGVGETVELIAGVGAAGCSIEDYDPQRGSIDPLDLAVERVSAAAEAARKHGMVLTARAENRLYGIDDLDDTIVRLCAYRDAGAEVVYAPGLVAHEEIRQLVERVQVPVNVLALRQGPSISDLAALGVRRVSTGGGLARAAYGALVAGAQELRTTGMSTYLDAAIPGRDLEAALKSGRP